MYNIKENLEKINYNIEKATSKSNRKFQDVKLIAVSKTVDSEVIKQTLALGIKEFGENRVQEIVQKSSELQSAKFHMIGHLQTNKVKMLIGKVILIHSVDSLKLAKEISICSKKAGIISEILVEINIAQEQSKYGIKPNETIEFIKNISQFENIKVKGLMCIAPFVENAELNRKYFQKMRQIFIEITQEFRDNSNIDMKHLSMGMTGDYEVAIEEGATIVRIGTGIFS